MSGFSELREKFVKTLSQINGIVNMANLPTKFSAPVQNFHFLLQKMQLDI
jgi:hypothetical protein